MVKPFAEMALTYPLGFPLSFDAIAPAALPGFCRSFLSGCSAASFESLAECGLPTSEASLASDASRASAAAGSAAFSGSMSAGCWNLCALFPAFFLGELLLSILARTCKAAIILSRQNDFADLYFGRSHSLRNEFVSRNSCDSRIFFNFGWLLRRVHSDYIKAYVL